MNLSSLRGVSRRSHWNFRRLAAVALCLGGGLLALIGLNATNSPDVPPGPSWTILNAPNINNGLQISRLRDVACAAANDCWSVGHHEIGTSGNNGVFEGLIQHWNGSAWSIMDSPHFSGDYSTGLFSVACNSAVDCWAVGDISDGGSHAQTVIEHWDGTAWSVVDSPNVASAEYNYLQDVACTGPTNCLAVGYTRTNAGPVYASLVLQWNGVTWTILPSANGPGSTTTLASVSCVNAADCWAVGSFVESGTSLHRAFAEHWNGISWRAGAAAGTAASENDDLNQVTCNSSTDCWAVGHTHFNNIDFTLIEHWNGVTWTIVNSPNPNNTNILNSVTCAAANDCWAIGGTGPAPNGPIPATLSTLILHWDGSVWFRVTSATVANENTILNGVTCVAGNDCWSVGYGGSDNPKTFAMHWNATSWVIVPTPSPNEGKLDNSLSAVNCPAANNCWAVGQHWNQASRNSGNDSAVLLHWDGNGWERWATLDDTYYESHLVGVNCVTPNDCWAVGDAEGEPLTVHWDGLNWNVVPSFNQNGKLGAVTCNSSSDCWAVGYRRPDQTPFPLFLHWDGTAWSSISGPDLGSPIQLEQFAVTCSSSTDCFAGGWTWTSSDPNSTLFFHWNGSAWSNQPPVGDGYVYGLACGTVNDCWAVGSFRLPGDAYASTAHWDGNAWSPVQSTGLFHSVTCVTSDHCYAAGDGAQIEAWDGQSWTMVPTETVPGTLGQPFFGIHCTPGGYCFAVGAYAPVNSPSQNLIEGRTFTEVAPTPTPTPTVTPTPTPTPSPSATPVISVAVSPAQVNEGSDATFTITASPNTVRPVTVSYAMGGKAGNGSDYTLSPNNGQATIPIGQDSASVILHALNDSVKEKSEAATMTLSSGSGYSFGGAAGGKKKKKVKAPSATVTITNVGP